MTVFDSVIYGKTFTDPQVSALFSDEAHMGFLLDVEACLARAQAALGIIPHSAASDIVDTLSKLQKAPLAFSLDNLASHCQRDGVILPGLLNQIKQHLPVEARDYLHWGATSQDIVDTACILACKKATAIFSQHLKTLIGQLKRLADQYKTTPMLARTRNQAATPITFGLKIAHWIQPLLRQQQWLEGLLPHLLVLQFGGSSGYLSVFEGQGMAVAEKLAKALSLGLPVSSWHSSRARFAEFASWLSLTTANLGKMAQDVLVLSQTEVAEVKLKNAGCSSAMPHKSNPVAAEQLLALARFNASQVSAMHYCVMTNSERDGAAWMQEWMHLPSMVMATSAGLNLAMAMAASLTVDEQRMLANLEGTQGVIHAEAALYQLAKVMGKEKAKMMVLNACEDAKKQHQPMLLLLQQHTADAMDMTQLADYQYYTATAKQLVDEILKHDKVN